MDSACISSFRIEVYSNYEGLSYETQDGLYDVAWSEVHENQLATASGDGSVRLWDVMLKVRSALIDGLLHAMFIEITIGLAHQNMARA